MPLTSQDLIQGFFYGVDLGEWKVKDEPKLMPCPTLLVVGSPSAIGTMLAFDKFPACMLGDLAVHSFN